MYTMSRTAKSNIERIVGLSLNEIQAMSFHDEQQWIENRTKSKLSFSKIRKIGILGRGNPLLAKRKIRTRDDLNKKSKKYIGI